MKAKFSPLVQKELITIQHKNRKLAERIEKQIALFEESPQHPSLRTHKLAGSLDNMWSISITMGIRMIYIVIDESRMSVVVFTFGRIYLL